MGGDAGRVFQRLRRWVARSRVVLIAGLLLILAGGACLYMSDADARGWGQSTLQAFGVGLVMAGVVDVIAISGLNQAIAAGRTRQEANQEAESMLKRIDALYNPDHPPSSDESWTEDRRKMIADIRDLLARRGDQMDPPLRSSLENLNRLIKKNPRP
jgi:hypothetical protein